MKVFGLCVNCIICSSDFRYTETVVLRCSSEQALLKILQWSSYLLMKLQAFRHSEICKIFKTIFFTEHLRWLILEISYELSLYCIMRMMIRVSVWYVLTLQRLFHFIAGVSFLSISFSFFIFFCGFYYLLSYWRKFFNISNKALELFLDSLLEFRGISCFSLT